MKILLADDDIDDCQFFKIALEDLKIPSQLTTVNDGEQLMILLEKFNTDLPHFIFLDLNMPRKNGFECLLEIKKEQNLKNIPVIMFSTSFEQEVINQLYENGAYYFIRKPSDFSQFKIIIQHTITLLNNERLSKSSEKNQNMRRPLRDEFVLKAQSTR